MHGTRFDARFAYNDAMPVIRIIVEGEVQGVGFRAFVRRAALPRGVTGRVWNRADGAVEIIAAHRDEAVLAIFRMGIRHGPGRVDRIRVSPAQGEFEEFEIGRST